VVHDYDRRRKIRITINSKIAILEPVFFNSISGCNSYGKWRCLELLILGFAATWVVVVLFG
jgi:hypothetical protein